MATERRVLIKSLQETEMERNKFERQLHSEVSSAVQIAGVLSSTEMSTEILDQYIASLGLQLSEMQGNLVAEKSGRVRVEQMLETQLRADREAGNILHPAEDASANLLQNVSLLGQRTVEAQAWALRERSSRCRLEQLLWAAQQRVCRLEQGLVESNRTVEDAVDECVGLSSQVRLLVSEKMNLEQEVKRKKRKLNSFELCLATVL